MTSFETPQQRVLVNPFDCEPQTPRNKRAITTLSRRVLSNLENLCPPTFSENVAPIGHHNKLLSKPQTHSVSAALDRMRDGSVLQRLKRQRDLENERQEEAMARLRALTTSIEPNEKGFSSPQLNLGRQPPERRMSGLARSA